jgi:hypothetical protein
MPPSAETTTTIWPSLAATILRTCRRPCAEPTDDPPNFNTFICFVVLLPEQS